MQHNPEDDLLLSRAEVQARFGLSQRFLEVAVTRKDGPPIIKIGRLVRYRIGDLRRWIDAHRVDPACKGQGYE